MSYQSPVSEIIRKRFSCRTYADEPIEQGTQQQLADYCAANDSGPFGTRVRFALVAATEEDRRALRGLGTYGFIKKPAGFIVGAVKQADRDMEDFGYLMERIILYATDLGLGTCWLGGSFTRSRFAKKIATIDGESVPAVASVGYVADRQRWFDAIARRYVGADRRRPWEQMFFDGRFDAPLSRVEAGPYAVPLEMVRLGPSASNKQPWRIVRDDGAWHFYLQRTPGYNQPRGPVRTADLQRIDMGIAMSHFELAADELGLRGQWQAAEPAIARPDELTQHTVSWIEAR
jgi:nitroreductase